jgi:hypothetical protein
VWTRSVRAQGRGEEEQEAAEGEEDKEEEGTRSFEGSGSQTDPQKPWYHGRAGIIPFRYSPDLLGGKGTSHERLSYSSERLLTYSVTELSVRKRPGAGLCFLYSMML